ncbi:MAG: hypothetical protein ABFR47_04865, partial [Verrucomicrobiota bacterium]
MKTASILLALALLPVWATANGGTSAAPKKDRPWIIAPMITSSPAFGNGGGAVGMYFFKPDKGDTSSPASSITGMGLYSDTDSYFAGLFARTFWREDSWRINAGTVGVEINNEFDITGFADEVRFTTTTAALFTRIDRRLFGNFFFGAKGIVVDRQYSDANAAADSYFLLADVEDSTTGQLGIIGSYDSRDHVRYPSSGNQTELGWMAAPEALGASTSYHITEGFSDQFIPLFDNHVLALRLYGRFTPSGTPYSG